MSRNDFVTEAAAKQAAYADYRRAYREAWFRAERDWVIGYCSLANTDTPPDTTCPAAPTTPHTPPAAPTDAGDQSKSAPPTGPTTAANGMNKS